MGHHERARYRRADARNRAGGRGDARRGCRRAQVVECDAGWLMADGDGD